MGPPSIQGVVFLVGAGPGDPGLITVRGAELLAGAEVVVYDRLVDPALLRLAPPDAVLVDAGKRPGGGTGQDEICDILVGEAQAGRTVVRLKGGDPFVYGRGGEECEALAAAGVAFEVVPGITSAVAAPAAARIPLTHRDHASWVAVATGRHRDEGAVDWEAVAKAPTSVVLMSVGALGRVAERLVAAGRDPSTPAALVSWATWARQRVVRAPLEAIASEADSSGIEPPAVLVVGDVVAVGDRLRAALRPPAGLRVLVLRSATQAGRTSAALRRVGAVPVELHALRVDPVDPGPCDEALASIGRYTWAVFTSTNAVGVVAGRLDAMRRDVRTFAPVSVAAVGPGTASALTGIGLRPDLVPAASGAAELAAALGEGNGRVAFFCGERTTGDVESGLEGRGWDVHRVVCYRISVDADVRESGREVLRDGIDAVLFTSGSTVEAFQRLWGPVPDGVTVCCIGPRTAEAARSAGYRVDGVAAEATVEALVAALAAAVRR